MKKMLKSLFVLALLLVQVVPMLTVNAEQVDSGSILEETKGKITIDNAIVGQTYDVYQILELESYSKGKAYAYKVAEAWEGFVATDEAKAYLSVNEEGYVSWVGEETDARAAAFARLAIDYAEKNGIAKTDSQKAAATTITFEDLELGYYLVDSSTGALCSLDTTDNEVAIKEKNTVPSVDKTVNENATYGDKNTADIGDTVEFKTEITVGAGAQDYVLYDKMSAGLTYQSITKVELKSGETTTELTLNTDYVMDPVTGTDYDFIMNFTDSLEAKLVAGDTIVVYYTAIINENAVIGGNGNENETHLVYGDGTETNHDFTRTYTFKFDLIKENPENEQLTGAEFELYAADKTTLINLVMLEDGTYRVATKAEIAEADFESAMIVAGSVTIKGLDEGTYYLKEITPPAGYNKLADVVEVTISATYDAVASTTLVSGAANNLVKYVNDDVTVINITGNELPSTGGMGTVLFIVIGSLMVLGFGVLLVTKLRMSKVAL